LLTLFETGLGRSPSERRSRLISYNDAKKVRRVLKAKSELISISLVEYEENMLRLEDVQLKLERHVKEMD
jgi:hypothetical protein